MRKSLWFFGVIIVFLAIFGVYMIEKRDSKLYKIKTAERLSVNSLYEQVEYTNNIVRSFLDANTSEDAVEVSKKYISHSFTQYYIQSVSLGLKESQNLKDIDGIKHTYLALLNSKSIGEKDMINMEELEESLLKIKNRINKEEAVLKKKIDQ